MPKMKTFELSVLQTSVLILIRLSNIHVQAGGGCFIDNDQAICDYFGSWADLSKTLLFYNTTSIESDGKSISIHPYEPIILTNELNITGIVETFGFQKNTKIFKRVIFLTITIVN